MTKQERLDRDRDFRTAERQFYIKSIERVLNQFGSIKEFDGLLHGLRAYAKNQTSANRRSLIKANSHFRSAKRFLRGPLGNIANGISLMVSLTLHAKASVSNITAVPFAIANENFEVNSHPIFNPGMEQSAFGRAHDVFDKIYEEVFEPYHAKWN